MLLTANRDTWPYEIKNNLMQFRHTRSLALRFHQIDNPATLFNRQNLIGFHLCEALDLLGVANPEIARAG